MPKLLIIYGMSNLKSKRSNKTYLVCDSCILKGIQVGLGLEQVLLSPHTRNIHVQIECN